MNILLTGGNGFLGNVLNLNLCQFNKITRLGRSINNEIVVDLEYQIPVFSDKVFDLVIHAAGLAHDFKNLGSFQKYYLVNLVGTKNLLKALSNSRLPKYFVFISSVSVYGQDLGSKINENTSLKANDPYGKSKIEAEKAVIEWCNRNNVIYTILRLPLLIGQNPPGNLGAMIKGIQKGYYFNIDGGNAQKSMVLVEDVANIIIKASEVGGIFNLTDGYHPTFEELSNHISINLGKGKPMNLPFLLAMLIAKFGDLLGTKLPLNTNKLKKITSDLTFDDSKAREAFGWNPTPVLKGFKINE
jgi:nucleoside-diphosphate-sugar epimerase